MQRELPRHLVEQLGMRRRIGFIEIVDWMDEAAAEKMVPQAIHGGTREIGIVGAGDPTCEQLALGAAAGPVGLRAVEKAWLDDNLRFRNQNRVRAARGSFDGRGVARHRRAIEERRQRPELAARPVRERMIVALSALHLHAEENPRRAGRDLLGLRLVGLKEGDGAGNAARHVRRVGLRGIDRRGQQLVDHAIVRHVNREAQPQPGLELWRGDARLDVLGGAGQHQPAPGVGEMLCMCTTPQQVIDDAARACRPSGRPKTLATRRRPESCRSDRDTRDARTRCRRPAERESLRHATRPLRAHDR